MSKTKKVDTGNHKICEINQEKEIDKLIKSDDNCIIKSSRPGCKDIWNADMAIGATFLEYDIPLCPTTAKTLPNDIITWEEAKCIYKKNYKNNNFFYDAYVCFYLDDYKFDGPKGIWNNKEKVLEILRHFAGVISPDFSTYQDFPLALKLYNTYRMRLYGYWLGINGIGVINNVRWGTEETYGYIFIGIPKNSIVAIGTVGGSPRKYIDRNRFETGLYKMVEVLKPHTIIVYGSSNYSCFKKLEDMGVKIISFKSQTARYWEWRNENE